MEALYLAPAVASALLVTASRLPRRVRSRAAVAVAIAGACAGIALAVAGEGEWRTTSMAPEVGRIVGAACACAWVLAAVLGPAGERWRTGAFVGVSAAGLGLFAANRWVVPALLFWICSGGAIVALTLRTRGVGLAALAAGAADAGVVIALAAYSLHEETWRLAGPLQGWPRWVALASLLVRAGAVPRLGTWQTLRSPAAAALPLLVGGSFVVMGRFVGGPLPWAGAALVAAAVGVLALALLGRTLVASALGAWPVLLMLASVAIFPSVVDRAGVAACLAVALVATWPPSAGRARMARGLGLALLPPFVGFGVVLSAAVAAFDRAAEAPTSLESIPWTGAAAILPLAVAGGVVLGVNVTLQSRAAARELAPAIATWVLAAAALAAGFVDPGDFTQLGRVRVLYALAVAVAAGTIYVSLARRHEEEIGPIDEGPDAALFDAGLVSLPRRAEVVVSWTAGIVLAASAAGVGWLTFEGLRTGFLS